MPLIEVLCGVMCSTIGLSDRELCWYAYENHPDLNPTPASVSGRRTVNGRPCRSTRQARQRKPPSVTSIIRQRTKIALTRNGPSTRPRVGQRASRGV